MNPTLAFPPGDNSTDTIISGIHFHLPTLQHWNYTLHRNSTLSNLSTCILTLPPYTPPLLFPNGTFINSTSCYSPILPLAAQGISGLTFGILFATSLIFTLINLRKHGRTYLPHSKRWSPISRRWQWYWMIFIAVCGIISSMTAIDVNRDYLPSSALILRSFFYTLMFPGMLAAGWEATRHWNSFQERQFCDADPFALRPHDCRSRTEFYMPLVFYLFDWLVFFMTIPRPWTAVQMQRSPAQAESMARPMATDARFKAGAIFAAVSLVVSCYCIKHSIFYYKQSSGTLFAVLRHIPRKFLLTLTLLLVRTGYTIASAFHWSISPYRLDVPIPCLYGLGYSPALLLLAVLNIYGFLEQNDDRVLIAQRARRNEVADRELAANRTSRKPSWWSKSHKSVGASAEEMLREMAFEPRKTSAANASERLDEDGSGKWWWQRRVEAENDTQNRQLGSSASSTYAYGSSMQESTSPSAGLRPKREGNATGSEQSVRSWQSRPQVVRSMLESTSPSVGLRQKCESSATGSEQSDKLWQSTPQVVRSMLDV
jgi:hypothetical protein